MWKKLDEEHDGNRADSYTRVRETSLPNNANVISSHFIYKINIAEKKTMRLKARNFPHGKRDVEKDDIRKDSEKSQYDVIRLML